MERFKQSDEEINIVCLSDPITILTTPLADVVLQFYSNNEPHIHLTNIKKVSADAITYARIGIEEIKKKFDKLGYDKIYTLIKDTDIKGKKLMALMGFFPSIIYETPIGVRMIKYSVETG